MGLIYDHNQDFDVVRVDLGNQFSDGGSWAVQPKVYILKNPVDSNQTRPETDPADWADVPAKFISGSQFHERWVPRRRPRRLLCRPLRANCRPAKRLWLAVGGVKGGGANDFISVSEVASYGTAGSTVAFARIRHQTDQYDRDGRPANGKVHRLAGKHGADDAADGSRPATPWARATSQRLPYAADVADDDACKLHAAGGPGRAGLVCRPDRHLTVLGGPTRRARCHL